MKAKLSSNLEENLKLNENENDIKWFLATDNMYSNKKKKKFKNNKKFCLIKGIQENLLKEDMEIKLCFMMFQYQEQINQGKKKKKQIKLC